jgi:hypothetical protein
MALDGDPPRKCFSVNCYSGFTELAFERLHVARFARRSCACMLFTRTPFVVTVFTMLAFTMLRVLVYVVYRHDQSQVSFQDAGGNKGFDVRDTRRCTTAQPTGKIC